MFVTDSRIRKLLFIWEKETAHVSSIDQACEHEAYQKLLDLGHKALPHIFKVLDLCHPAVFVLLGEITKANPVPAEDAGNFARMTEHWTAWARENRYLK